MRNDPRPAVLQAMLSGYAEPTLALIQHSLGQIGRVFGPLRECEEAWVEHVLRVEADLPPDLVRVEVALIDLRTAVSSQTLHPRERRVAVDEAQAGLLDALGRLDQQQPLGRCSAPVALGHQTTDTRPSAARIGPWRGHRR